MRNILLLLLIITASSCSIFHKHKSVERSKTDSTSRVSEKKDSSVVKDIVTVKKNNAEVTSETVLSFDNGILAPYKDSSTDKGILIYPTNPNDYFEVTPDGKIRTNVIPRKVVIRGTSTNLNLDSAADHSKINLSDTKDQTTEVTANTVTKNKDVSKKSLLSFWWLLALMIPIVIYRKEIWGWIKHMILPI